MQTTAGKTILITGANTGLGKEMARQLARGDDFERIYLGCRNPEKAQRAKQDLEKVTGHKIFEVVIIDLEDLASVGAAVAAIAAPLNALAMIAGGIGGPTPASLTEDRVTELFAQNLLGHVVLLEICSQPGCSPMSRSSQAARGRAESRSCGSPDQRSPIKAHRSSRR